MATANSTETRQVAFTLAEFAAKFGKHRCWAYRLADEGLIRTISGYGTKLVPASEVERILNGEQEGGATA
jgi:hypothetical protein